MEVSEEQQVRFVERYMAALDPAEMPSDADFRGETGALADLAVRLLTRLYLSIEIRGPKRLADLALAVNPKLDLVTGAQLGVVVGDAEPFSESIFAGSDGWRAVIGVTGSIPVGSSENSVGPGAAACLAAAALFRRVLLDQAPEELTFDAYAAMLATDVPGLAAAGDASTQMPAMAQAIATGHLAATTVVCSLIAEFAQPDTIAAGGQASAR